MNSNKTPSVWLDFIQNIFENKRSVAVFLNTGVKIQGTIVAYDQEALRLKCTRDKTNIVVFTTSITTISDKENSEQERNMFN